jgi:hypothetical protein
MEIQGYPQFVMLLVLGIGIPLAFFRPFTAFALAVFLITAADISMFIKTRTAMLGPFLNLADTCVLLALLALLLEKYHTREPFRLPVIIALMLFVLTLGAAQSLWLFGFSHNTMASVRYALDVPIAFFLGANFVTSTARAKKLIAVLLCGAAAAAVQHIVFVATLWRSRGLSMETFYLMRTISFSAGALPSAFLIAATVWKLPRGIGKKGLGIVLCLLFLATLLLNQTRSLWIATAAGILVVVMVLKQGGRMKTCLRLALGGAAVVLFLSVLCRSLMPGLDVSQLAGTRIASLAAADAKVRGVNTRKRAFHIETRDWFAGTLVLGRGLGFFQIYPEGVSKDPAKKVAFGHLGYVTYLSQLGLIGLLVYGLCLPLSVFRNGWWLWRYAQPEVLRSLGLLGIASIVCLSIMFVMSSQFLVLGVFAPGVLYGAVWAAVRGHRTESSAEVVSDDRGFVEAAPDEFGLNGQML